MQPTILTEERPSLRRVVEVEQLLTSICRQNHFSSMFGSETSWAIVGGTVRDALLFTERVTSWPDIDIAVAQSLDTLPILKHRSEFSTYTVARNSYGGLKITGGTSGDVDVWAWIAPEESRNTVEDWQKRLAFVDFGLNAAAFVWPQAKIVLHPRWIEDLQKHEVEILASPSSLRGIQVVRSIALATKVSKMLNTELTLGVAAQAELRWFVLDASREDVIGALDYLRQKVDAGRWGRMVEQAFFEICSKFSKADVFWSCVLERDGTVRPFYLTGK